MPNAATDLILSNLPIQAEELTQQLSVLVCCIAVLLALTDFIQSLQSSLTCYVRWKECVHLSDSPAKMRRCAIPALLLSLPFICIGSKYSLHPLTTFWGTEQYMQLLASLSLVASFFFLHRGIYHICRLFTGDGSSARRALDVAINADHPFFMLNGAIMTTTAAVAMLLSVDEELTRTILLWELGVSYAVCLVRKFQIFFSYRGFFAAFLYLCALEFIPCGALIAGAML